MQKKFAERLRIPAHSPSLRFNGIFLGEAGLASIGMFPLRILLELRMMEAVVTTAAIRRAQPTNCTVHCHNTSNAITAITTHYSSDKIITKHSGIDYLTYQFLQDVLPPLKEYLCSIGAIRVETLPDTHTGKLQHE